jgi:hypothetical protein
VGRAEDHRLRFGGGSDIVWPMSKVRIESIDVPFLANPRLAQQAALLVARAETMGFLGDGPVPSVLDVALVRRVVGNLAQLGVATSTILDPSDESLARAVDLALEGSEHSPMPEGEWPVLIQLLGEPLLGQLLGVSPSSIRRYDGGARSAPDEVAGRLHLLALVVSDLAGAYNEFGIRRWFTRPRSQLGGSAPADLLIGASWDPDGSQALRIRALAAGLTGAGAP